VHVGSMMCLDVALDPSFESEMYSFRVKARIEFVREEN
jgi:hypothetical protein